MLHWRAVPVVDGRIFTANNTIHVGTGRKQSKPDQISSIVDHTAILQNLPTLSTRTDSLCNGRLPAVHKWLCEGAENNEGVPFRGGM
jgi:hypothetical protein